MIRKNEILEIETGIAVPPENVGKKYPWGDMQVGNSIFIKCETPDQIYAAQKSAGGSCRYFARTQNPRWRFTVRIVDSGLRIWRLE